MNPISHDTAVAIAKAHREIVSGEALLAELAKGKEWHREPDFRTAYGDRARSLQLGIPQDTPGSHRLYDVSWSLAVPVIQAHVATKRAELVELSIKARMEMDAITPPPTAPETP